MTSREAETPAGVPPELPQDEVPAGIQPGNPREVPEPPPQSLQAPLPEMPWLPYVLAGTSYAMDYNR